jgi:hypothetical protein
MHITMILTGASKSQIRMSKIYRKTENHCCSSYKASEKYVYLENERAGPERFEAEIWPQGNRV